MQDLDSPPFLAGGGEMGQLTRDFDWGQTSLGYPGGWPKSLQIMLATVLHSKFPMFIWWGPELLCFYNDAYRPSLGNNGKHPSILGQPAKDAWPEIWPIIYPLIEQVMKTGEGTWSEDQLVPIYRNGTIEDVYWTFGYSRIIDDNGDPGGVLVTCVETTEKVINQKALADTRDMLLFATEAANLGTWDYNPASRKFVANALLADWFALSRHQDVDMAIWFSRIKECDRQRVINAMQEYLNFGHRRGFDIDYTIVHPITKEERVVNTKGKAYFDELNMAYRFSGVVEDITEKKKVQLALEESEKNMRSLIEQSPVATTVLMGPEHIVTIANDAIIKLWGKTREEVMGRPIFECLPEARNQGLEELLANVYNTGESYTAFERPVNLPRSGELATVYQNFVYERFLHSDGSIKGIIAVTIDVTEQVEARKRIEEAEERARLAVEAANLGTFDLDVSNDRTVMSPRFFEIFGIQSDTTHLDLISRIFPEDRHIRDLAFADAMKSGKLTYEVRIKLEGGEFAWIHVEGKVIFDKFRKPVRVLGTVMDFTAEKEHQQKREEYIAIASHELRNPLTSLKLSLDMLSTLVTEKSSVFLLEKGRDQVKRLITMTAELLNVAKISSGILDIKPEVFNLKESILESIRTVEAGAPINFVLLGEPDINLHADKFRIEQVLINLISNASKYSPKDSEITIRANKIEGFTKVEVIDKGIGIDPDKLGLVFKKFSRLEKSKRSEGYGLGLYISHQIINMHGGQMGVESIHGKGSTFWFILPL